ncbi:MAG: ceramidase domain-containing protein [Patescibacteria group bacterium]|jgi:hypothetical protein
MKTGCPYQSFAKPVIKFCEQNLCSAVVQPANAWSNLAYLVAGVVIFYFSRQEKIYLKAFGLLVLLMGLTSFLYHASYTFLGQMLDLSSMFLFSSYLLVLNFRRTGGKLFTIKNLAWFYILLNAISIAVMYYVRLLGGFNIGIIIFALQVALVLLAEFYIFNKGHRGYDPKYLLIGLVIIAAAAVFWMYDYTGKWCDTNYFHLINGHALWHVLTAVGLIFVYLHYKIQAQALPLPSGNPLKSQ